MKKIIQKHIKHIKTIFYSFIGGQYQQKRKYYGDHRDSDWYYQHSWFERKWFKHKSKRFIMRNVYRFIDKVEDILFEKTHETYYCEFLIKFNESGLLLGKIPLILKIKNGENIISVAMSISNQLSDTFKYKNIPTVPEKINTEADMNLILKRMEIDFSKFSAIGKIVFNTVLAKQELNFKNITPLTLNPNKISSGFKILNRQLIDFGIVRTKDKRYYINHEDEFQIFIQFDKEIKKVIDKQPTEKQLDVIKELMGLKTEPPTKK